MAPSPLKGLARRVARPLSGPLDGRVADINRRVGDTHLSVSVLSKKVDQLARELAAYTTTSTESNSYVGVEMRRLEESIETLLTRIDEHESRLLSRIDCARCSMKPPVTSAWKLSRGRSPSTFKPRDGWRSVVRSDRSSSPSWTATRSSCTGRCEPPHERGRAGRLRRLVGACGGGAASDRAGTSLPHGERNAL